MQQNYLAFDVNDAIRDKLGVSENHGILLITLPAKNSLAFDFILIAFEEYLLR